MEYILESGDVYLIVKNAVCQRWSLKNVKNDEVFESLTVTFGFSLLRPSLNI